MGLLNFREPPPPPRPSQFVVSRSSLQLPHAADTLQTLGKDMRRAKVAPDVISTLEALKP